MNNEELKNIEKDIYNNVSSKYSEEEYRLINRLISEQFKLYEEKLKLEKALEKTCNKLSKTILVVDENGQEINTSSKWKEWSLQDEDCM